MTPNDQIQPGLLKLPASLLPEEATRNAQDGYVVGLVTEVTTNLMTGSQVVRIDLESPSQAAEKILREADNGRWR